jgi:hypothetical protein
MSLVSQADLLISVHPSIEEGTLYYFWQVNIARKGAGKPSTVKSSLLGSKKSLMDCVLSPIQCVERCVFSMGVLYHQKNPLLHLQQLKTLLIDEGELILETLIIDKKHGKQIIPKDRYARMRKTHLVDC